ncbi:hypothetical protein FB451DRAFT_1388648 [Mycena latifolia]|nr:hypothetical protein FB451DRAFT_1388648 [Mycena latifolia]
MTWKQHLYPQYSPTTTTATTATMEGLLACSPHSSAAFPAPTISQRTYPCFFIATTPAVILATLAPASTHPENFSRCLVHPSEPRIQAYRAHDPPAAVPSPHLSPYPYLLVPNMPACPVLSLSPSVPNFSCYPVASDIPAILTPLLYIYHSSLFPVFVALLVSQLSSGLAASSHPLTRVSYTNILPQRGSLHLHSLDQLGDDYAPAD